MRWVPFIDITGITTLEEVVRDLQRRGVRVMIAGANERVSDKLDKAGVLALLGPTNLFGELADAIRAAQ
jgi:SulP family sulfate permease